MGYCKVCFEDYDDEDHRPMVGSCGHTLCRSCLDRLDEDKKINCVFCSQTTFISPVPNYDMIGEANEKKEKKGPPKNHSREAPPIDPYQPYQSSSTGRRQQQQQQEEKTSWQTWAAVGAVAGAVAIGAVTIIGALAKNKREN